MPVEGLPSALEAALNALLCDNTLSSFKIDGRGDSTVVILRLTGMAHGSPAITATYRKKPPSHNRRDYMRAEARRQERSNKASDNLPLVLPLFMPTPPTQATNSEDKQLHILNTPCTTTPLAIDDDVARVSHDVPTPTDRTETSDDAPTECSGTCVTTQLTGACAMNCVDSAEADPSDMSVTSDPYTLEERDYVASIMDRSLQRRLRDNQRNTGFEKCVLYKGNQQEHLLCRSDDITVVFDCEKSSVCYWFIHQGKKLMSDYEQKVQENICRWTAIDPNGNYQESFEMALIELENIGSMVRRLLG